MTYIKIPLETNQTALAQEIFDYIQTKAPGWAAQDATSMYGLFAQSLS